MTTLDTLANRYGIPRFVKIDVEGGEAAVLRGMTFTPDALSFEYHPALIAVADACLDDLAGRGYRFRATVGFKHEWATPPDTPPDGILDVIRRQPDGWFGDVYATR